MGRIFLADEKIQAYVENLQRSGTWYLGLVIGKLSSPKDYVVHIVRTPEPMEDQVGDDDADVDAETSTRKRRKSQTKPATLEAMNELWASTHAKQVTMMLPGGLNVIGIFVVAPDAMIDKAQPKLRQILFAIQKQEKKSPVPEMTEAVTDRVLLQICSTTKKYTCRTIDVSDPKSTFRPADWKFQPFSEVWNCLETSMGVNIPVDIPEKSQSTTLAKQIQNGLQPFCQRLQTSLVQIDDKLRKKTELLDQSAEKKGKHKDKSTRSQTRYICNILVKHSNPCPPAAPVIETTSTRLLMRGTIHGRAYVTSKATVNEAEQALQIDVIRSVLSRCELLCDDIQMIEEDAEAHEVYTTPRRVFFNLPGSQIQLCDYMFTDEKPVEVKGRVQELLDISLEEDDLDLTTERPATEEDFQLLGEGTLEADTMTTSTESNKGFTYYIVAGVGGLVAMAAAAMTYVFSENT
ncbi:protein odr-4 homolog [Ruditapes philippinarum]|uniref:protein odr-4 homolog n=1 Tax=Ruditapes philippinarum TaxID=129788 RepID=UPI00295AD1FC|nr:protein odr-4 homolog [Ruditapes philippinarum]